MTFPYIEQPALWDEWNTRFVDGSQPDRSVRAIRLKA